MTELDLIDRKILAALMADATQSIARIAEQAGLSQTPCWKRIQRLEADGVLTGRVALADPARLGCGLTVFVGVEAPEHGSDWRAQFLTALDSRPEVMEVHRLGGEMDYMLRLAVPDMAGFDAFYQFLTAAVPIRNLTSHFVLERLRHKTVYPLQTGRR